MNAAILKFLQQKSVQDMLAQGDFKELFKLANEKLSFHQMEGFLDILHQSGIYFSESDLPQAFKFVSSMIGRRVRMDRVDSELWEEDPEDEQLYRDLLGHVGTVTDVVYGEYDPSLSNEENFYENYYWEIWIDGTELSGFHGSYFTLLN